MRLWSETVYRLLTRLKTSGKGRGEKDNVAAARDRGIITEMVLAARIRLALRRQRNSA